MRNAFLFIALGAASVVYAQANQGDTLRLKDVEVVRMAKAPVALTPLDVTTVSAAEIQRSTEPSVLPVLQNRVPGLFVTERGMGSYGISGGAAGAVSIRGVGGGNKVLFMIDGQPQWAGVFGHGLPDTYVSGIAERVEVVSGPSSILYGSNAMGGSINIITRKATRDGVQGFARAQAGSFNTQRYNLNVGYKKGGFNSYFAGSFDRSNGERENSNYWLATQYGSLQYTFNSSWSAGANFTTTETISHNPGEEYDPIFDGWARMMRQTVAVYVHNDYDISSGGIQAYWNGGQHKINDGHTASAAPRDYFFRSTDYNVGFTIYQTVRPWSGNNLSLGFDFKQWGGHTWYDYFDPATPVKEEVDRHVTELAGYAMMQQSLAHNILNLNAGVRIEHSSQFGTMAIPQAGFILRPFAGNTFKFSFGKGFRSPNIRELYIKYSPYGPCNPDLKPEEMFNYEIEWRQLMLDGRLNFGLSLFLIDGKNMMQNLKIPDGPGYRWENSGAFKNKGFELDLSYRINSMWTINTNYAYLHTNTFIAYAPKNKLFAEVMFTPGRWEISLENMNIWSMRPTEDTKISYSLLNSRVAYNCGRLYGLDTRLFARVDNITATRYHIMAGYPMPLTTVMAGLEVKF